MNYKLMSRVCGVCVHAYGFYDCQKIIQLWESFKAKIYILLKSSGLCCGKSRARE